MGKRYYCDYCDRTFIDDIDSRKNHLKGVKHQSARREYYLIHRDLKTFVSEERQKSECHKFRSTGHCNFGIFCMFTHYTRAELDYYERQVLEKDRNKNAFLNNVDDFMAMYERRREAPLKPPIEGYDVKSLPPSLHPITVQQMIETKFEEWG